MRSITPAKTSLAPLISPQKVCDYGGTSSPDRSIYNMKCRGYTPMRQTASTGWDSQLSRARSTKIKLPRKTSFHLLNSEEVAHKTYHNNLEPLDLGPGSAFASDRVVIHRL